MAIESKSSGASFDDAIRAAIRQHVTEILKEEIEKAKKGLEARLLGAADQLALNVLSHYSVYDRTDRLVIEVRKP